jgi:hypothetical protein
LQPGLDGLDEFTGAQWVARYMYESRLAVSNASHELEEWVARTLAGTATKLRIEVIV